MGLLRQKAGLSSQKSRSKRNDDEVDGAQAGPSTLTTANGHINFFEDFERVSGIRPQLAAILINVRVAITTYCDQNE